MLRVCVVVQTVPRALRRRRHRHLLLLSRHLSVEVLHWHTWVDPPIVGCARRRWAAAAAATRVAASRTADVTFTARLWRCAVRADADE